MSEFGRGFAYCLGLFLAHAERHRERKDDLYASLWFSGAADHLFELVIPNVFTEEKRKEISDFKDRCISFRFSTPCTWEDVNKEIQNAKDFLRQYDEVHGIESEKGEYE